MRGANSIAFVLAAAAALACNLGACGFATVVEDCQIDPAKVLGIGNHVDFDDHCPRDREAEDHKAPSTRSYDDALQLRT